MICTVHTKLNSGGNLTKLSDDKLVSVPLIQMQNMAFKIRASDIGKVSDNNVRICNRRLHIYFFVIPCNRMYCIWVWVFPVFHLDFLRKDTAQTKIPLKELEAQIAGLDFDIEQEKQQTYTFLSPDKIENYLNSVICSDIQEMPVRKPIVKTCVREVILDNDSVTITYNFTENYAKYKISKETIEEIKKQSLKKTACNKNRCLNKLIPLRQERNV